MEAPESKHPVFGSVVSGMDVINKIAAVQIGAQDKPVEEVIIISAKVLE